MKYVMIGWLLLASSGLKAQKEFLGKWLSPTKTGIVETYLQGNKLFGKLIWVKTERNDIYNSDKSLRNRAVKGLNIFTDFTYEDNQWSNGKIYDAVGGSTYSSKMWLSGDKKTLFVRGYIGLAILGRTEQFTRVD